jgi:hypothetical protein
MTMKCVILTKSKSGMQSIIVAKYVGRRGVRSGNEDMAANSFRKMMLICFKAYESYKI